MNILDITPFFSDENLGDLGLASQGKRKADFSYTSISDLSNFNNQSLLKSNYSRTCYVKSGSKLFCWHALRIPDNFNKAGTLFSQKLVNPKIIAMAENSNCYLDVSEKVLCSGNEYGNQVLVPKNYDNNRFYKVTASRFVFNPETNYKGNFSQVELSSVLPPGSNVVDIDGLRNNYCVLTNISQVYCWGHSLTQITKVVDNDLESVTCQTRIAPKLISLDLPGKKLEPSDENYYDYLNNRVLQLSWQDSRSNCKNIDRYQLMAYAPGEYVDNQYSMFLTNNIANSIQTAKFKVKDIEVLPAGPGSDRYFTVREHTSSGWGPWSNTVRFDYYQ